MNMTTDQWFIENESHTCNICNVDGKKNWWYNRFGLTVGMKNIFLKVHWIGRMRIMKKKNK